jgi:hypothetical protein
MNNKPAERAQRHVIVRLARSARNPFSGTGPWLLPSFSRSRG